MTLASEVPTPFIFVRAWLIFSEPSKSVPATRIMCWYSRVPDDEVDMFVSALIMLLFCWAIK